MVILHLIVLKNSVAKECPTHPPRSNKAYHADITSGALQSTTSSTATETPAIALQPSAPN